MTKKSIFIQAVNSSLIKPEPRETDYESFRKFQSENDTRYEKIERERVISERKLHLEQWDNKLPNRWKKATLNKVEEPFKTTISNAMDKNQDLSFFIQGNSTVDTTFISYAILRRLVGKGLTTVSRVKSISEEEFLSYAYMGFKGRDKIEAMFDPIYNTYFFDNFGEKDSYDMKEIALWERMIDHIYTNSHMVIFSSVDDMHSFADLLSPSGSQKLIEIIGERLIHVSPLDNNKQDNGSSVSTGFSG